MGWSPVTYQSFSTPSTVSFSSSRAFLGSRGESFRPQQDTSAAPVQNVSPPHTGQA